MKCRIQNDSDLHWVQVHAKKIKTFSHVVCNLAHFRKERWSRISSMRFETTAQFLTSITTLKALIHVMHMDATK